MTDFESVQKIIDEIIEDFSRIPSRRLPLGKNSWLLEWQEKEDDLKKVKVEVEKLKTQLQDRIDFLQAHSGEENIAQSWEWNVGYHVCLDEHIAFLEKLLGCVKETEMTFLPKKLNQKRKF